MRESERKALKRAELRAQGLATVTVAVPMAQRAWLLDTARLLREGFPPPKIEGHTLVQAAPEPLDKPDYASEAIRKLKTVSVPAAWIALTIAGIALFAGVFKATIWIADLMGLRRL